ncbi:MAG: ATP-binding cassette domain-containing protein [Boseongicola sp.]|nr:ATP-binding cassette domain-containing protein [Boseongicola sp.]
MRQPTNRWSVGLFQQSDFNRTAVLFMGPLIVDIKGFKATPGAHAHDVISGSHDSKGRQRRAAHVGEPRNNLSSGQRQRITLTRVMLKDAPITILKEAASARDREISANTEADKRPALSTSEVSEICKFHCQY